MTDTREQVGLKKCVGDSLGTFEVYASGFWMRLGAPALLG